MVEWFSSIAPEIWVDIGFGLIFLIAIVIGYCRGVFGYIFNVVGIVGGTLGGVFGTKFITTTFPVVESKLSFIFKGVSINTSDLPDWLSFFLKNVDIDLSAANVLLSILLTRVVLFVILFIGISSILRLIGKVLTKGTTKVPVINPLNRFFGSVISGVLCFLYVSVVLYVLALFSDKLPFVEIVKSSHIAGFMYDFNLLGKILTSFESGWIRDFINENLTEGLKL